MEQSLEFSPLAQDFYLSMAASAQQSSNLGQSTEKGIHWTFNLCYLLTTRGKQRTYLQ